MQKNLQSDSSIKYINFTEVQQHVQSTKFALIELSESLLKHVGGGAPNSTWKAVPLTTSAPNSTW